MEYQTPGMRVCVGDEWDCDAAYSDIFIGFCGIGLKDIRDSG